RRSPVPPPRSTPPAPRAALPPYRRILHVAGVERIRLWRRLFRVGAVVGGGRAARRLARGPDPDQRRQLLDRGVDHPQCSLSGIAALSAESLSKSADSSPCTRITSRAVSSSARTRAISAAAAVAASVPGLGPRRTDNASSAPLSC